MDDDLKQMLETMRQENTAAHVETRRHFEIVAEDLRHELRIVAEGVALLTERIDRRDAQDEHIHNGSRPSPDPTGGSVLRALSEQR